MKLISAATLSHERHVGKLGWTNADEKYGWNNILSKNEMKFHIEEYGEFCIHLKIIRQPLAPFQLHGRKIQMIS